MGICTPNDQPEPAVEPAVVEIDDFDIDDEEDVDDDESSPDVTGAECTDIVPNCAVCFRRRGKTLCRRCDDGFKKSKNKKICSATDEPVVEPPVVEPAVVDIDDEEDADDNGSSPDVTGAECTDIVPNCAVCFRRRGKILCRRCDDGFKKSKNKKIC